MTRSPASVLPAHWLERVAAATLILNLLDAVFTLLVVTGGFAVEANPLMDTLISRGPLEFMVGKLALVSLGILLLWRMRWNRLAEFAIVASLVVYIGVVAYHIKSVSLLAAA